MRRLGLAFAFALLAAAGAARAQMSSFSAWQGAPTAEDLRRVYPQRALAAHLGGTAVLDCEIGLDGYLKACLVVSETPRGYDFGQAALAVAGKYRMEPKMTGGRPTAGGRTRLPVVFSTPGQATAI
ncbi:MAG: hypothetical protein BGN86_15400 [Caulobacterales bacterium 68-7]|nr:MAG: hypothetical protein BGN86_15400 [Caulobacterales bacterium 68-7]